MIQIAVYSFVFGMGFGGGRLIDQHTSYFEWLIAGIAVWFFVNQAILQGSKSVYTRIRVVSQMSFPMSVIPTFVIFAKFYQHLMVVFAIFVILQFTGSSVTIQILQLPYYMFASISLMVSISLITSTLSTIVRDIQMMIQAVMRVLFYLTPILWPISMFENHKWIQTLIILNPLNYVVEGYRSSLLGDPSWFAINHVQYTIYFWAVVIIFFIIGSLVHVKFRDRFVDFL
jgi:teichoic acid transport system permease protein